ncbi:polysaccharide deacetylase family protein [Aurantibacter sp.]|uniref:polysaccharide deacetylase family protein n=1 Tax=Aurantibacter sp. TaxID=2807103 RepID=UPI0035C814D1
MLLVYTPQITPRVKYTFKQVCTRILGISVSFTSTIEDFIAHDSLKMSYAKQPLGNEFFVRSHDLLFENGLNDLEFKVYKWEDTKCFFINGELSHLPFDIFSATFYLLSRYEEYLPHVKDEYGRFMATESLAFQNDFLHQPVVDIWANRFKKALQEKFPDFEFQEKTYKVKPVIDVPLAFKHKHIGFFNSLTGFVKDILNFKIKDVYLRISVLLGFKRDSYNTYKYIINRQKKSKSKFLFFFLVGDYSSHDKTISVQNQYYVSLIKHISDYCSIGLKTSYEALSSISELKKEKKRLELITNKNIIGSRQSFSKVNLPEAYRNLVELEIPEDYTMGYIDYLGFRAGTCSPFLFYDLDFEIQTPLKINSYQMLDYALLKTNSLLDKQQKVAQLVNEIKKVNGTFIPVFHNYTFSDELQWIHFKSLFKQIIND